LRRLLRYERAEGVVSRYASCVLNTPADPTGVAPNAAVNGVDPASAVAASRAPAVIIAPAPNVYYVTNWVKPAGRGASQAYCVELGGYAKTATSDNPFVVVNERIASKLGAAAALPIPPGALLLNDQRSPAEVAWFSMSYLRGFGQLPDVNPAEVAAALPELTAGVIAFDYIIANTDRNAGNLALVDGPVPTPTGIETRKRLEVFDHSHAVIYKPDKNVAVVDHLKATQDQWVIGGSCLVPHVTSAGYLLAWAGRLQERLTDAVVREACLEAPMITNAVTGTDAEALAGFLCYRRDAVQRELHGHAADFKAVPTGDWATV
jgi:hypothetical protein